MPSTRPKLGWLAAPAVQSLPWAPLNERAPLEGCLPTAQLCWHHDGWDLHSSRRWFALKAQPQRRRTRLDCLGHAPGPGRTRGEHALPRGCSKSPPPETLRAAGTDRLRRRIAGPAIHVPIFASVAQGCLAFCSLALTLEYSPVRRKSPLCLQNDHFVNSQSGPRGWHPPLPRAAPAPALPLRSEPESGLRLGPGHSPSPSTEHASQQPTRSRRGTGQVRSGQVYYSAEA